MPLEALQAKIQALNPKASTYLQDLQALCGFLEKALGIHTFPPPKRPPILSWESRFWLGFGLFGGALLAVCDSFSNMTMIMGAILTASSIILGVSVGFAVLALAFFLVYQLVSLARAEQISWLKMPKQIRQYMEEKETLNTLAQMLGHARYAEACFKNEISYSANEALRLYIRERLDFLKSKAMELDETRSTVGKKVRNTIVLFFAGSGIFISGFSIGLYALASLFALFSFGIPLVGLLAFGSLVGLIALTAFWVGQREEVVQMLDRLSGVDEKWIEALSSPVNLVTISKEKFGCIPLEPSRARQQAGRVDAFTQYEESANDGLSQGLQALPLPTSSR